MSTVVATPLVFEQRAVERTLRAARVVRTGMGPRKSTRSRSRIAGPAPLVVMGVAGGLSAEVNPGDVVIASEVRDGHTTIAVTDAAALVAALRDAGFRVHHGPIVSVPRVVGQPGRAELAATGAIAVDTESAWLADGWPGRPVAVVRTISDSASAPLWQPGTVKRGLEALRVLRRVAPYTEDWAAANSDEQGGNGFAM